MPGPLVTGQSAWGAGGYGLADATWFAPTRMRCGWEDIGAGADMAIFGLADIGANRAGEG